MAHDDFVDRLLAGTSRRTFLKTGTKLAYAAPVIAASMSLNHAAAQDCAVGQDSCNGPDFPCGENPLCFCSSDTEGRTFCAQFTGGFCDSYQKCAISEDCPSGQRCAPGPDCCNGICLSPCAAALSPTTAEGRVSRGPANRGAPPIG